MDDEGGQDVTTKGEALNGDFGPLLYAKETWSKRPYHWTTRLTLTRVLKVLIFLCRKKTSFANVSGKVRDDNVKTSQVSSKDGVM